MKIIKKDGRLEEFNLNKIKTSIENAANDAGAFLNQSDLKILASDVENTILAIRKDSKITSSYEIIGIILSVLKKDGFTKILSSYLEFDR